MKCDVSMSPCLCLHVHVSMSPFLSISMSQFLKISMSPCFHFPISMCPCFRNSANRKRNYRKWVVQMKQKTEACFYSRQTIKGNRLLFQQTCISMVTVTSGGHVTFEKMRCYISSINLQELFCLLTFTVVNVSLQQPGTLFLECHKIGPCQKKQRYKDQSNKAIRYSMYILEPGCN